MTNKYLTKVCALLKPPVKTNQHEKTKPSYKTDPIKGNKYAAKINKMKQRKKIHNGDTIFRQHKVK
jgi:hypothetical protein